jgi:hypothetical protein
MSANLDAALNNNIEFERAAKISLEWAQKHVQALRDFIALAESASPLVIIN